MANEKKLSGAKLPGYHQIRQHVFAMLNAAPPTAEQIPLTTEKELCEFFKVSRGTVRKALQMLTDEGLLVRRPHYGTFISPRVISETVHQPVIGVILGNGELMYWDSHVQEVLSGIFQVAAKNQYQVHLISFMGNPEQALETEFHNKPDGIIWLWATEKHSHLTRMIKAEKIPLVNAMPLLKNPAGTRVWLDYEDYGYELAQRLIRAGYPDMLFMDPNIAYIAEWKRRGVRKAFAEAGLDWDDAAYLNAPPHELCCRADELLPTGRFRVVNGSGVLLTYEKKHPEIKFIIPQSNIAFCKPKPPFPALAIPGHDFGRTSAELLFRLIRHPEETIATDNVIKAQFA